MKNQMMKSRNVKKSKVHWIRYFCITKTPCDILSRCSSNKQHDCTLDCLQMFAPSKEGRGELSMEIRYTGPQAIGKMEKPGMVMGKNKKNWGILPLRE